MLDATDVDVDSTAVVGAVLFYASDGVIGVSRIVRDFPHSRLVVMSTYHLGQIGLVLALV